MKNYLKTTKLHIISDFYTTPKNNPDKEIKADLPRIMTATDIYAAKPKVRLRNLKGKAIVIVQQVTHGHKKAA